MENFQYKDTTFRLSSILTWKDLKQYQKDEDSFPVAHVLCGWQIGFSDSLYDICQSH